MKLSIQLIKQFDIDQAQDGARAALVKLYSRLGAELMQGTKKAPVKSFLADQAQGSTKSALYNVLYHAAEDIFHGIGVVHIKTAHRVFGRNKGMKVTSRIGDADAEHGAFQNMRED